MGHLLEAESRVEGERAVVGEGDPGVGAVEILGRDRPEEGAVQGGADASTGHVGRQVDGGLDRCVIAAPGGVRAARGEADEPVVSARDEQPVGTGQGMVVEPRSAILDADRLEVEGDVRRTDVVVVDVVQRAQVGFDAGADVETRVHERQGIVVSAARADVGMSLRRR